MAAWNLPGIYSSSKESVWITSRSSLGQWLGIARATSDYMNQCWPISLTHICIFRPQWVIERYEDDRTFEFGIQREIEPYFVVTNIELATQWTTKCFEKTTQPRQNILPCDWSYCCPTVSIDGSISLVHYIVKPLPFIWRFGTNILHLYGHSIFKWAAVIWSKAVVMLAVFGQQDDMCC